MTRVAESKKLLKHLRAFDDRNGETTHGAESWVVTEVGWTCCQNGFVSSKWLTLNVNDDITQLPLQPQLIELSKNSVAELRHIKLDVAAVVHFLDMFLQFVDNLKSKRKEKEAKY